MCGKRRRRVAGSSRCAGRMSASHLVDGRRQRRVTVAKAVAPELEMSGSKMLERAKGIEPSYAAWEAAVLPLNYARKFLKSLVFVSHCCVISELWATIYRDQSRCRKHPMPMRLTIIPFGWLASNIRAT